jgi:hypothetical protein
MPYKLNLSKKYEDYRAKGHTEEEALDYIYKAGAINTFERSGALYSYNPFTSIHAHAATMRIKKSGALAYTPIIILQTIFVITVLHKTMEQNISGWSRARDITALMNGHRKQTYWYIDELIKSGYIERAARNTLRASIVTRKVKDEYLYRLSEKGTQVVRGWSTDYTKRFKQNIDPEFQLKAYEQYNHTSRKLQRLKHWFNSHRETIDYESEALQPLGLLVTDFKTRFPKKGK